jgi:hypothetical protein
VATKARLRCSLSGESHAPLPNHEHHTVRLQPHEKPWRVDRCPWGLVLADPIVRPVLNAHARLTRFSQLPPGRGDPRTELALHVVALEHDRIDVENLPKPKP